jgi:hypothetical protein
MARTLSSRCADAEVDIATGPVETNERPPLLALTLRMGYSSPSTPQHCHL